MISIATPTKPTRYAANILPCRIKHTGPVNASSRHWNPTADDNISYFRGRKLIGTSISLPEGYTGHVLTPIESDESAAIAKPAARKRQVLYGDDDDEGDEEVEVSNWESGGTFESVVVWGHEVKADPANDGIMRGLTEWMEFSSAINGFEVPVKQDDEKKNGKVVDKSV